MRPLRGLRQPVVPRFIPGLAQTPCFLCLSPRPLPTDVVEPEKEKARLWLVSWVLNCRAWYGCSLGDVQSARTFRLAVNFPWRCRAWRNRFQSLLRLLPRKSDKPYQAGSKANYSADFARLLLVYLITAVAWRHFIAFTFLCAECWNEVQRVCPCGRGSLVYCF